MEDRKAMFCPLLGGMCAEGFVKGKMHETKDGVRQKCRFWIKLSGKNPQTGEVIDDYDCAHAWGPTLQVELARLLNSSGGAIESLRNKVAETNDAIQIAGKKMQRLQAPSEVVPEITVQNENEVNDE